MENTHICQNLYFEKTIFNLGLITINTFWAKYGKDF